MSNLSIILKLNLLLMVVQVLLFQWVHAMSVDDDCIDAQNQYRYLHGVPKFKKDSRLIYYARWRAHVIAKSDGAKFNHIKENPYGENLAMIRAPSQPCGPLVKLWYDEISMYNFNNQGFSMGTGHFTQLVWAGTTRVGCAVDYSSGPIGGTFLVCIYDPPGNVIGLFERNVFPRKRGSSGLFLKSVEKLSKVLRDNFQVQVL